MQTIFAQTYQYQEEQLAEPAYILHDGPPYANGDLHMGHAINKVRMKCSRNIYLRSLTD